MKSLAKLERVIDLFRAMDHQLPSQVMSVFLAIARSKEALETRSLPNKVGLSQSAVNRALVYLQDHHWSDKNKPGLQLITQRVSPIDARQRVVELTTRGKKLVNQIEEIING